MITRPQVWVCGGFDDLRSGHLRFLEVAAGLGEVTVVLWADETVLQSTGRPPKFPLAERLYLLQALRYVSRVVPLSDSVNPDHVPPQEGGFPDIWADETQSSNTAREQFCRKNGIRYVVIPPDQLHGFSEPITLSSATGSKKVIVTGCFDWLHSGHVRFFEEVSRLGDLYVIVGHDANIRLLKGPGHPLFSEAERRYNVGSIKYVTQALISSGNGWLDADPEIRRLKPDTYAVNEDGDKGGKREFCREQAMEYVVLRRMPAPGLICRSSTELRGF